MSHAPQGSRQNPLVIDDATPADGTQANPIVLDDTPVVIDLSNGMGTSVDPIIVTDEFTQDLPMPSVSPDDDVRAERGRRIAGRRSPTILSRRLFDSNQDRPEAPQ